MQDAFVYMYICVCVCIFIYLCVHVYTVYRYTQNISGKIHKKLVTSDCLPGQEMDG